MGNLARTVYAKEITKEKVVYSRQSFKKALPYYQLAMKHGRDQDVSTLLNLASFLKAGNCKAASEKLIEKARKIGHMSRYAKDKVIPSIQAKKPEIDYCKR